MLNQIVTLYLDDFCNNPPRCPLYGMKTAGPEEKILEEGRCKNSCPLPGSSGCGYAHPDWKKCAYRAAKDPKKIFQGFEVKNPSRLREDNQYYEGEIGFAEYWALFFAAVKRLKPAPIAPRVSSPRRRSIGDIFGW